MKIPVKSLRLCAVIIAVLAGWQTPALQAQLTRGFVSGVIRDPSGAVIVGAHVRIINKATNEARQAISNQVGVYRFVALEPETYTLEFSAPGFQTRRVDNVRVGPAQEVVLDETLAIRGEAVVIEVMESPPETGLARATPTIEKTLYTAFLASAPLTAASRDVSRLALLTPTVTRGPGFTEISANGQRTRQNNFLIDGTDNNDLTVTFPSVRMIPEAVGEFQVQITPYSAEYGRNTGAQISILTPRGSNTLHGEVWDYYRGNWMEPVSLLNKQNGLKETPRFVHNQTGASLGGPVRRDRTFFFGLLETNRRREAPDARNAQPAVVPSPAGFAALATVPLGSDQTPQSRQAVLNALAFLPDVYKSISAYQNLTSQVINGVPIQVGTIRIPLARRQNSWYGVERLDHRLTEKDNLSYRYIFDKRSDPNTASNLQFGSRFAASAETFIQNHALSHTHIFGLNLVNEFRFSYGRNHLDYPENDPNSPTVQISGAFTFGGASNFPQGRISNTFQWQNITTYMFGRHSLKFGADIHRNRLFNLTTTDWKGTWTFLSLADFINNRAFSLRQTVTDASYDARQINLYYFFQDDFKVTRNLTFDLGLRYEYSGVPFGFFGAATPEIAAAGVPLPAKPDKNNWAPRFGFAYSPSPPEGGKRWLWGDQRTVFRGGFGIAYDVLFYNILSITASNYPRVVRSQTFQPQTINLFPILAPKDTTIPPFSPLTPFANTPTDIQNATTSFWSFSIQRQLSHSHLFEIGYTGNRSYHLLRQGERNPGTLTEAQGRAVILGGTAPPLQGRRVNPAWGSRATIESTALGAYHAFFLRLDRKMANGLLLGANYTWSANFSDNDEPLPIGDIVLSSPQVPQNFFDYRNEWSRSAFDRPHRFVVHYLYEIPGFSLAGMANSFLKHIFSGWQISGFSEWQSGKPFTVQTGVDSGGSGVPVGWRPDYNPAGIITKDPAENDFRTFTVPVVGGIFISPTTLACDLSKNPNWGKCLPLANSMPFGGNLGRNTFRGPIFSNWNFSLSKTFTISERLKLRLRSDWFNLWNHRNFGNPVATINPPASSPAPFGTNTTDPGGRSMLLGVKVLF